MYLCVCVGVWGECPEALGLSIQKGEGGFFLAFTFALH